MRSSTKKKIFKDLIEHRTIKEDLMLFFESITGQLMTEALKDEILYKKYEFNDWITKNRLDYLFDRYRNLTPFERQVLTDINVLLEMFDQYTYQINKHDEHYKEFKNRQEEDLRYLLHKEFDNVKY